MRKLILLAALLTVGAGAALACLVVDSVRSKPVGAPQVLPPFRTSPMGRTLAERKPSRVSLQRFSPFLARPELATVRAQVEDSSFQQAANALATQVSALHLGPTDQARAAFLLGRLWEKAGQLKLAEAQFREASVPGFQLSGYAQLSTARVLIANDHAREALAALPEPISGVALAEQRARLKAKVDEKLGNYSDCIRQLRGLTDMPAPDPELLVSLADVLYLAVGSSSTGMHAGGAGGGEGSRPDELEKQLRGAIQAARQAISLAPDNSRITARAEAVIQQAIRRLSEAHVPGPAEPSVEELHAALTVLVQRRLFEPAIEAAAELAKVLKPAARFGELGCDVSVLQAKALAGTKDFSRAADLLADPVRFCQGSRDSRAKLLYLAAKYAAAAGRHAVAARTYEQLESETPESSLADDARLRAAQSYQKLGSDARFVELLSTIVDDYPEGDLMLDGVFALALSRIEKNDWSAAAATLDRVRERAKLQDRGRSQEFAGRERYFSARAWIETGELARGLAEYEAIIDDLPLSYYMLHAYSRLRTADAARAARALAHASARAQTQPFYFEDRPEYSSPGFLRAMELLGVGEVEWARRELAALGLERADASPGALWGVALLYSKAGAAGLANNIARGLLTDWLEHWPAGDWEQAWQLAFPTPFGNVVEREAKRSGTPEFLTYAIMREESVFDPEAKSPANAFGLMQLIVPTAKMLAEPQGLPFGAQALLKPALNIRLGTAFLAKLNAEFSENPLLAIPSYNAGSSRSRQWKAAKPGVDFDVWVELIPFYETRRYTKRVLASRATYAWLYKKSVAEETLSLPLRLN